MKALLFGIGAGVALSMIIGILTRDADVWLRYIGYAAVFSVFLSAVFSGALLSGDRIRANYASETPEDRIYRIRISTFFLGSAVGLGVIASVIYFLGKSLGL